MNYGTLCQVRVINTLGAPSSIPLSATLPSRWSGVRATVDGQIRTGDVRRFRTGHERYQRGDFVNRSVAVERCIGLLGCGPIARGGI
jgi:hypothetical protein